MPNNDEVSSPQAAPPFEGTPNVKSTEIRTYREEWKCPQPGCQGNMVIYSNPTVKPYDHRCNVCSYMASLPADKYPRDVRSEIGGG